MLAEASAKRKARRIRRAFSVNKAYSAAASFSISTLK
jgi:hypothetical protein